MATPIIAGVAAATTLVGGAMSSSAAGKAASAQADAAREAGALQAESDRQSLALQREIFNQQRADIAPFRQAGLTAQNQLMTVLGLNPTADTMAPITQFDQKGYDRALDNYYARMSATGGAGGAEAGPSGIDALFAPDAYARLLTTGSAIPPPSAGANAAAGNIPMPTREQFTTTMQADQLNVDPNAPDFGKYARDFGMQDFQQDPGYAFRMSEGMKALDRQAASRGGLISGSALKAAQRFGQDLGSQEYGAAFNRYQINRNNQLNPLMAISGKGQLATNTLGGYGSQFASGAANTMSAGAANQANALGAAGQARASGYVGQANALNSTLGNLGNIYGQFQAGQGGSPYGPSIYGSGPITSSTNYFGE